MNAWVPAAAGGLLVVLAVVVAVALRRRRRSLSWLLTRLSRKRLADFMLPDDVDGEIHIDFLLMTPGGLVVLDVRRMAGTVFAAEGLDGWTALHKRGRTVVKNPLPGLRARVHAVQAVAAQVPVTGYVLILGDARFSGLVPDRVITPAQLEAGLPPGEPVPEQALQQAWEAIGAAARRLGPGTRLS